MTRQSLLIAALALAFAVHGIETSLADNAKIEKGGRALYVSHAGKNENPGTQDAPFATIAHAASVAKAGDTVKIGPGLYREQVRFTESGQENAPIAFVGARGKNGEYLTIVEAPGRNLNKWETAPEIAPAVWKTPLEKRPDLMMMDGKMIALVNPSTMALPRREKLPTNAEEFNNEMLMSRFGPDCKRLAGFDLMSLSSDIEIKRSIWGTPIKEKFWPVIDYVLAGWSNGFMYIHFANDDKPENHVFTVTNGEGFLLKDVSHLIFRDLHLRGSRRAFYLRGNTSHNTIEECLLMHGGARVKIDEGVSHTIVRNCILTAGFIRGDLFKQRAYNDMRGDLLYAIFKFIIGYSTSDDMGIEDDGNYTKILSNNILQGLIGIEARGVNCEVRDNVVRGMSSIGICTSATTVGIFTGNLVMNCGLTLRIHGLRHKRARREEYHYRNLYVQEANNGNHMHVHSESFLTGPDMVNFEKGTNIYKQNPPDPVDAGKIYIYHNTFWGGFNYIPGYRVTTYATRFRMAMPFFFVNNIIKGSPRMETYGQELFNGNLLYTFDPKDRKAAQLDPEVAKLNRLIGVEETKGIWNEGGMPGLPELTLKADSPALECAIDISRPFKANNKDFPAFPGFKPGYFKGNAPAAGAFQLGESQDKFYQMFRKSENILKSLNDNLKN